MTPGTFSFRLPEWDNVPGVAWRRGFPQESPVAQRTVTFDADDLLDGLDALKRVQMPFVMSWALNAMAPRIKGAHERLMQSRFENPVPFTTKSVRWGAKGYQPWVRSDKANLEMGFWVSEDGAKGQPPSYYLYPQVTDDGAGSKEVYVTRFTKRLRREGFLSGSEYATPLKKQSNVIADLLNGYGNIRPGQYTRILFALGAMETPLAGYAKKSRAKDSVFIAPNRRNGRNSSWKPGIYRRKGGELGMLFKILPSPPSVTPKYEFARITTDLAQDYFPDLVEQKLGEVMRGL